MGLMDNMFGFLFGDGAQKTIEIFKENAERAAQRAHVTKPKGSNFKKSSCRV